MTVEPADFVQLEGIPAPHNATYRFIVHDGVRIRVMVAAAARSDARGTIVLIPGRTEFIEKYFETVIDLQARGFVVMAIDHRGQGLSDRLLANPLRGYVRRFSDYTDDLAHGLQTLKDELPEPRILMGHSMGGTIGLLALIDRKVRPAAAVFLAPMTQLYEMSTPFVQPVMRGLARIGLARLQVPFQRSRHGLPVTFRSNVFTTDEARYGRWARYFRTQPQLRLGSPTFGWLSAAIKAMHRINAEAKEIKVPMLIVGAGADPIVSPVHNAEYAERVGAVSVNIPGALHEILMERDELRDQFWSAFDNFLADQAL